MHMYIHVSIDDCTYIYMYKCSSGDCGHFSADIEKEVLKSHTHHCKVCSPSSRQPQLSLPTQQATPTDPTHSTLHVTLHPVKGKETERGEGERWGDSTVTTTLRCFLEEGSSLEIHVLHVQLYVHVYMYMHIHV